MGLNIQKSPFVVSWFSNGVKLSETKETRLLVSGRGPECSDCLLRFYGAVITSKTKSKKKKMKFFYIFYENHHPTRHIKYEKIGYAPCNKSIMANKLLSTNLEQF